MKFLESMLCPVQEQRFIDSIAGFLDKFDCAVEDKGIMIDFADTHSLGDSVVGLDTGSQKLVGKMAIFNSEDAELPTH